MIEELRNKIKSKIIEVPNFPKQGINFKDINPLLNDSQIGNEIIEFFIEYLKDKNIQVVAGIESRGFLYAHALSLKMKLPFVMIRKEGKLPRDVFTEKYTLEYGEAILEIQKDAIEKGQNVFLFDDLLATGGTIEAACKLILSSGAKLGAIACLVNLTFLKGNERIHKYSKNFINFVDY